MTVPSPAASTPDLPPAVELSLAPAHPHPHSRRATFQAAPRRFPRTVALVAVLVMLAALLVMLTVMLLNVAR
jgi:hypothetical protein